MMRTSSPEAENLVFTRIGVEPVVRWKPLYTALNTARHVDEPLPVALETPGDNDWEVRETLTPPEPCELADYISRNIEGIVADSAQNVETQAGNVAEEMRRIGSFLLAAETWFRDACANGDEVHIISVSVRPPEIIDY